MMARVLVCSTFQVSVRVSLGASGRRGESGTARRNVLEVQAHGALTAGLLEPHVGGGELLHEVGRRRLGEGLRTGLHARLSPPTVRRAGSGG